MSYFFYQTKISKLNGRLFPNENVFWFNISMEEAMWVNVFQWGSYLEDDVSYFFMRKGVIVKFAHLHHPVEIHV